ncbi:hypothetical protein PV08_00751 [Exophiala spinifera]|uniref:Endonuclease/exonuclease/phosphatase domain-containing protein n=1 Tax=Exophiala spinifera TaxID=91928 RepID=A0A0D1YY21_9EURO|nr:uncharacterized protein PV08_00751 [Exophiala spinifera]KIW20176.1 hypothetical protein PV08_00751 [Exophiala spinifera]
MDPKLKRMIELIESKKKPSHPWKREERHSQPYYTFSPSTSSWDAVTPAPSRPSDSPSTPNTFTLVSWNIDFMLPYPDERMAAALNHLQSLTTQTSNPTVILLQEMLESDLSLIQAQAWVRSGYHMTDVANTHWESGHYGTVILSPKALPVTAVFRVHYEATAMERDGLFVDLDIQGRTVRICNTHLESLVADPPKRPLQVATAARHMHDPGVAASVLAGDLNAIQPFDKTLHSDNDLQDAYLALGGQEDSDDGYTWGQQAPTKLRNMFGCSRMDKVYFCGAVECTRFERVGAGVTADEQHVRDGLVQEEDMDQGWVTDHLGVLADFTVLPAGPRSEPKI